MTVGKLGRWLTGDRWRDDSSRVVEVEGRGSLVAKATKRQVVQANLAETIELNYDPTEAKVDSWDKEWSCQLLAAKVNDQDGEWFDYPSGGVG
jgi:hypothetical protein